MSHDDWVSIASVGMVLAFAAFCVFLYAKRWP